MRISLLIMILGMGLIANSVLVPTTTNCGVPGDRDSRDDPVWEVPVTFCGTGADDRGIRGRSFQGRANRGRFARFEVMESLTLTALSAAGLNIPATVFHSQSCLPHRGSLAGWQQQRELADLSCFAQLGATSDPEPVPASAALREASIAP